MNQSRSSVAGTKNEIHGGFLIRLASKLITDGASEWNLSRGTVVAILSVPVFVALSGILTGLIGKETYKWFTGEDGFAENLQVLFYSIALLLSLMIMRGLWSEGHKGVALLYALVSLGLFFLVGEELNWGQMIFEWETPETLAGMNKQGETNLHNIYGVGTTFKWVQLLVGAYGTLLPVLVLRSTTLTRFQDRLSKLVPHFTLIPYFMFMFLWKIYRNLFEAPKSYYFAISEYNEVIELILAMGFFLFMVFQLRRMKGRDKRWHGRSMKNPGIFTNLAR